MNKFFGILFSVKDWQMELNKTSNAQHKKKKSKINSQIKNK